MEKRVKADRPLWKRRVFQAGFNGRAKNAIWSVVYLHWRGHGVLLGDMVERLWEIHRKCGPKTWINICEVLDENGIGLEELRERLDLEQVWRLMPGKRD